MTKDLVAITKPGIVRGNVIVALAAFLFASDGDVDFILMLWLIIGVSLVIASGCVANNYLDKDIDAKMDRTKDRSMAIGKITMKVAVIYAATLGVIGFLILWFLVNVLTALVGIFGFIFYVFIYGYFKRTSVHGTLIGTIPGATPPLAGYVAVTNNFDWAALLLFLVLVFWQMPHFYAISILRIKDYKKADLPLLPIVKSIKQTKYQMIAYIGAFIFTVTLMFGFGLTGIAFYVGMLIISIWWATLAFKGLEIKDKDSIKWAGKMFGRSLTVLLSFCLLIAFNWFLP